MSNITKEHYDQHLANFYSWMAGDFDENVNTFSAFLNENRLKALINLQAVDLGAGHGIQSVALAKAGYEVEAVDFSAQLLEELKSNSSGLAITLVHKELLAYLADRSDKANLIACWGDTLTHLPDHESVVNLITSCAELLHQDGHFLISFRDYTVELEGDQRIIPVKSDNQKILTCLLEYQSERVRVTDILHEASENGWKQKVSHYFKIKLDPSVITQLLKDVGLTLTHNSTERGMIRMIAKK